MKILAAKFFKLLIAVLFFTISLYAIRYTLYASPIYAAEPPTPLPCQNPVETPEEILTDNWLTKEGTREPREDLHRIPVTIQRGRPVRVVIDVSIDFSRLSAIFATSNSNFNEGNFQDPEHKNANIVSLSPADFSKYYGPVQKATPRAKLDPLRVKYVEYVNANPTLAESGDTFTDFEGKNPKTIHELVNTPGFGIPNLPEAGQDRADWENTWGRYWSKIPTSYNEFYKAYIKFRAQHKGIDDPAGNLIQQVLDGAKCPYELSRTITFVMPENFRATAISGQLNTLLVPKEAQSDHTNNLILNGYQASSNNNKSLLAKIWGGCLRFFKSNPISKALQKVISSLRLFDPPEVLAQTSDSTDPNNCIRVFKEGKEGQGPYCALPVGELQQGERCTNQQDNFKLDKENPNVICTFRIVWERPLRFEAGPREDQFDYCDEDSCTVYVSIWPVFRIPWLSELMNNSLYSDTPQNEPFIGSPASQREGRPGVFSFFTPRVVFEDELEAAIRKCTAADFDQSNPACQDIINIVDSRITDEGNKNTFNECVMNALITNPRGMTSCIVGIAQHLDKKRPGKSIGEE